MDQTEEQEEYNQQKTEENESWENEVENLTEKLHGMDEKLNTSANLIADIAAQAREGKLKYESGKKKARTYVDRQNLPQPSSSRNHEQATEASENTSTDTSVTKVLVTKKRKMTMTL